MVSRVKTGVSKDSKVKITGDSRVTSEQLDMVRDLRDRMDTTLT